MIEISRAYLIYICRKEKQGWDEFQEQYHIQYLGRTGDDIFTESLVLDFDDPKYETMFKLKFQV